MINKLTCLRKQIDAVDKDIITLLERRLSLVREVARIKNNEVNIPLTDLNREDEIIHSLQKQTHDMALQDAITDVYKVLFAMSKSIRHMETEVDCPFTHVGIIGDGLIGRSIAKAIKSKKDARVKVTIHNREWKIEHYATCDLIIIATPIETVVHIATELAKHRMVLQSGVVIIDVASVKKPIAQAFAKLDSIQSKNAPVFVPTHPMGGGQEQGSSYARATLFAGRPWLITPTANTPENIISKISKFVAYCGSRPIIVGAEQHDKLVTYVSHFPGILSQLLLDFVSYQEQESLRFAGSGFEMMTRIGKSNNIRMRSQIAQSNAHNIREVFDAFIHYIHQQDLELWKTSKSQYLNKQ